MGEGPYRGSRFASIGIVNRGYEALLAVMVLLPFGVRIGIIVGALVPLTPGETAGHDSAGQTMQNASIGPFIIADCW